jgi:hypothetical protein
MNRRGFVQRGWLFGGSLIAVKALAVERAGEPKPRLVTIDVHGHAGSDVAW